MKNIALNTVDIINSQVDYEGAVKVFYVDKNSGKSKIIYKHNEGKIGLFTAICRMLVGLSIVDFIPSTIMAYSDEDCSEDKKVLTRPISYASAPVLYYEDDIAVSKEANAVQYTFLIPASSLITSSTNDGNAIATIWAFALKNNEDQICAALKLNKELSVSKGSNIIIYWKLKFSNFEQGEN